jgi:hypothetical protein
MVDAKRGQASGAGAAILLVVIVAVLIGFIVMLPPSERAELLGEDTDTDSSVTSDGDIDDAVPVKTVLKESPGRIDYLAQDELPHALPVINIYTQTESKILGEKNVVSLKHGVFSEENDIVLFSIPDMENTGNLVMGFKVVNAEGRLKISLNGDEVFNREVTDGATETVTLPVNSLTTSNKLLFEVSSAGAAFWKSNELTLENVRIAADVTSVEAQESRNVFLVSDTEKNNLEKGVLKFKPDCEYEDAGRLMVYVNEREVYAGFPDCDLERIKIDVDPEIVYQGENEIVFSTARGVYVLSHVEFISELKEVEFPTYYFELSYEQFRDIENEKRRLRLEMDFVDVVTTKRGSLVFNGHIRHFDTKEAAVAIDLSDDAVQGHNSVKIKPKKTIDVRQIKVDIVK